MLDARTVYDITVALSEDTAAWPGDTPLERRLVARFDEGSASQLTTLTFTAHLGTHVDAPGHFSPSGKTIDQYAPERFILPATVVEAPGGAVVGPEVVAAADVARGGAVLFKTANSRRGVCRSGAFCEDFACIAPETAAACVEKGASLVGIDCWSIDAYRDATFPAHRALLDNDVLVLETIDLAGVPPGPYTLICLPLKLTDCEASPVRAVLLER